MFQLSTASPVSICIMLSSFYLWHLILHVVTSCFILILICLWYIVFIFAYASHYPDWFQLCFVPTLFYAPLICLFLYLPVKPESPAGSYLGPVFSWTLTDDHPDVYTSETSVIMVIQLFYFLLDYWDKTKRPTCFCFFNQCSESAIFIHCTFVITVLILLSIFQSGQSRETL